MKNEQIKSWTLNVEEDPESGDSIITFPPEVLKEAGWSEGDTIVWTDNNDGSWTLKKVEDIVVTPEEEEAWQDLEQKQQKK